MGVPARVTEQGKPVMEQLAARWVVTFSMVLIGAFSLIRFLPSPTGLPDYARFLPADPLVNVPPEQAVGREPEPVTSPTDANVTAEPTLPSTTSALATVKVDSANCRDKPRGNADRVTILYRDQEVEILGRNEDLANPWWYIKIPDDGGNCWLWGMTTDMTGTLEDIPIVR